MATVQEYIFVLIRFRYPEAVEPAVIASSFCPRTPTVSSRHFEVHLAGEYYWTRCMWIDVPAPLWST